MKSPIYATEARTYAYTVNKMESIYDEITNLITKECRAGKFTTVYKIDPNYRVDVLLWLIQLGYNYYQKADGYTIISWEDRS